MWNQPYEKFDVENGAMPLFPMKHEIPEQSWSFTPKDYFIVAMQLLATIAIDAVIIILRPNSTWFFADVEVILEVVKMTAVVVTALILFTFWATRRDNFLFPLLFGALQVLAVFGLILFFFPLGELYTMIFRCMATIIFCANIVFYTVSLVKSSN